MRRKQALKKEEEKTRYLTRTFGLDSLLVNIICLFIYLLANDTQRP